jgi:acyl-CoA synthetase (NDP forming)
MSPAPALAAMLQAESVAVVGASTRSGSFGEMMMIQLLKGGFDGRVYPVNPRYEDVMGHPCLPSLAEVPEPVDLAILGVSNLMLETQLRAAADAGARSAVIFASCHEEPRGGTTPLPQRLASIAREAGMALCGGNGMGFVNFERRLRACGFSEPLDVEAGGVTFVTHSGSAFSALLHNDRGLIFNLAVSSGLELVTTASDYVDFALDLPSTRVIALFLETVRDPRPFRAALAKATARDVPVVALKVGRGPLQSELVAAHSGALAGEHGAYQALFDAHGVLEVQTLDELADTVELLAGGRRAGPGGLAAIHDSGGERVHLMDVAASEGVRFADISEETRARLAGILEPGLPAVNPLDAWGTGNDADEIFVGAMRALLDDPDTAALAFCVDLTTDYVMEEGYTRMARDVFAVTDKPVAILSNLSSAVDRRDAAWLRGHGIPVLEGTATGLAAIRHLFELREYRLRPPVEAPAHPDPSARSRWRDRLASGVPVAGHEALGLLSDYRIPVAATADAVTADEAVAEADRIGWPVALKTARPDMGHKADVGGVRLGLADERQLREAYAQITGRLGHSVLVSAMAPHGVELALGIVHDPQFGPLVMVSAGGVLIEVLRDGRFALPPLDPPRASAMLDRLSVRPLLDGVRGAPPADLDAVAQAIVGMSTLAEELGDSLDVLDVNPLIAGPAGCVAVDALVVPRAPR